MEALSSARTDNRATWSITGYNRDMELYARVNILEGRAVRLGRGSLDDVTSLDADPLNRARGWVDMGVDYLLVVDLDAAAYRSYRNRPLIDRMLGALDVPVVVAGGIRSEREAARLIERGAWKVTMGTAAIEHTNMIWDLCRDYPGRMMISLDVLENEELVTRGWTSNSGRFLEEVMVEMASCGVSAFFVADARRDVLTEPPNVEILRTALEYVDEPVIASGGVRHLDDLRMLTSIDVDGRSLAGLVVGREVTEGRFSIGQAKSVLSEPSQAPSEVRQMRVVIPCRDINESIEFYQGALGLPRLDMFERDDVGEAELEQSDDPGESLRVGDGRLSLSVSRYRQMDSRGVLLEVGDGRMLELVSERRITAQYSGGHRCRLVFVVDDVVAWLERIERFGLSPNTESVSPESFHIDGPDGVTVTISKRLGLITRDAGPRSPARRRPRRGGLS